MDDNHIYKETEQVINITAESKATVRTNITVYSYDKNTAKFLFRLTKNSTALPMSNSAVISIALSFGTSGKAVLDAVVEDELEGLVSMVIPEEFLGYEGTVTGGVYINYSNGQSLDCGYFTFSMKRSMIDELTPEMPAYYVEGFENLRVEINDKSEEMKTKLSELDTIFKDLDVYNKAQVDSKVNGLKPAIDEVTAQLAKNQQEISKINNKIETTKLKDLQEPFYISHRGGANIFPENTIDAFKGSLALGSNLIEMDVQTLSDGSLGVMHDSTVDRTTNKTGNVADYSAMGFRNLEVNVIPNQGNAKAPLFDDVVITFGKSAIYAPESKDRKSVKKIVDTLERHDLKEYAIIQSFEMEELKYAIDKGYACLFLSNSVSPISIKENGIDYVGVSKNVSDSYLQSCLSSGLKVVVYTVNHRYERDKFLNKGVHGFFTDDPFYLEETVKPLTTDPYLNQVFYHGMLSALTNRGDFAEGDRFGFLNTIDRSFPNDGREFVLQGWSGKLPNTFILEFDYKYIQHITSGWLGIQFCTPNDFYDDSGALTSGYNVILGANNNLTLYRNDNGVATSLGTLFDNGATGQNPVPIKIEVTRDTITITRKDLGLTKTFTDGKYRGGYFHFGRKWSAGTFGNVKIG